MPSTALLDSLGREQRQYYNVRRSTVPQATPRHFFREAQASATFSAREPILWWRMAGRTGSISTQIRQAFRNRERRRRRFLDERSKSLELQDIAPESDFRLKRLNKWITGDN